MTTWSGRPRVIRLLTALVLVGIVLAAVGLVAPRAFGSDGTDSDDQRKQVASRAADFAVTYNTYDVANLPDYQKRLKGLLTPKYDKQFVQVTNAVFTALKDKKQKSGDAKVLAVGLQSLDQDSADALVAVDASITNTDNAAAVLRHFRWKVSFTRVAGDWRVSNFESVASVGAQATTPSAAPSTAAPGGGGDQ